MANIYKREKEILNKMTELTPQNVEIINQMFENKISARQIYSNLSETVKKDPQIIEILIKNINPASLKSTLKLITEETEISRFEFLKMASKYHPVLVAKYIRINKLEVDEIIEIIPQDRRENEEIYKVIESSKIYSQEEKNKIYANSSNWVKDGKAIQYIEIAPNIQFQGRDDYVKLVEMYLNEDVSTQKFCNKYKIDKNAFNKVLDILSTEDKKLREQIDTTREKASQRYMAFMTDLVEKVINGEITIKEVLNTSGTRINGWDFLNSLSFTTKEQHVNLLRKMIEEINLDYRNKQQDEMDTKYKLDKIGGFSMEELAKWFDTQKGQPVEDIYNALGMIKGRLDYMDSEWEHKKMARIFFKYAKTYGGDFSKEVIDQTFFENPDNNEKHYISEKNIQDALTILKANNKVASHRLTKLVIKDIIYGKISEDEINEAYRIVQTRKLEEKEKNIRKQKRLAKLKNIDEYINYINSPEVDQENPKGIEVEQ